MDVTTSADLTTYQARVFRSDGWPEQVLDHVPLTGKFRSTGVDPGPGGIVDREVGQNFVSLAVSGE